MAKPNITTRAGKGAQLTFTEVDSNFTNLQNATVAIKADAGGTDVVSDLNGTVTLVAGTNVTITGDNTAKTVTINAAGGSGITDLVQDLSPQLGGDLDVNGKQITSSSNGNISIVPNGSGNIQLTPNTGKITLGANDWPSGPGSAGQVLTTAGGTGVLSWTDPSGGSVPITNSSTPTNAYIAWVDTAATSLSTVYTTSGTLTFNPNAGVLSANQFNANGNGFQGVIGGTVPLAGSFSSVDIKSGSGVNIYESTNSYFTKIKPASSGQTQNITLTLPSSYSGNGQFLQSNTAGVLSWANTGSYTTTTTNANYNILLTNYTGNTSVNFTGYMDATSNRFAYNPSTGVLTVPSMTGAHNGTVGATTPNTGAFTTLSASSTVSGTGFSTYLASPPAIGSTTPSTVATTQLSYSGAGTGGTVTQLTSRTTGVTLSTITGTITLFTTTAAASSTTAFTLTNTKIAATDQIVITHQSGGTMGLYFCTATPAAGSATIYVRHVGTATSASEAPILKFTVIKSVNA